MQMKTIFLILSFTFLFSCSKDVDVNPCIDLSKLGKSKLMCCIPHPVCGCDGVEYFNECAADNAGVISWTEGPCSKIGN